jgi:hypothetical protein
MLLWMVCILVGRLYKVVWRTFLLRSKAIVSFHIYSKGLHLACRNLVSLETPVVYLDHALRSILRLQIKEPLCDVECCITLH